MTNDSWLWMTLLSAFVAVTASILIIDEGDGGPTYRKQVQACDVVVHRLMTTNNLVELQRDEFLVKQINCGVMRRAVPLLLP